MADLKVQLGDSIKRRRQAQKMEQGDLAREASRLLSGRKVTEDQISRWETGKNLIRLDVLLAIASILQVSIDELIMGEDAFADRVVKLVLSRVEPRIERIEKHVGL